FNCELAVHTMMNEDMDQAMTHLTHIHSGDRNSARVSIMMGRIFMTRGDYAHAVETLEKVISQDRELVSETLEMLQVCYQ
ncbi:lipopolysaccharide assembly protein LapB, partial [Enterobacter kobei]|nr:lipopolysaccharide assembly protein LapB [Enterobacter kobei]